MATCTVQPPWKYKALGPTVTISNLFNKPSPRLRTNHPPRTQARTMATIFGPDGRTSNSLKSGTAKEINAIEELLAMLRRGEALPRGFKASPALIASMNAAAEVKEITNVKELLALLENGEILTHGFKASPHLIEDINAATKSPSPEGAKELYDAIKEKFPRETLGTGRWYLVVLSALLQIDPTYVGNLYTYLINQPKYRLPEARQALVRRMREALVKNVSIQGVCKPLEAIYAIAKVEKEDDKDYSFSRQDWQSGPENLERGETWLQKIYKGNLSESLDPIKAHQDFIYISRHITYGFYLSDHSILDEQETELVVLSGIMIQNLKDETAWHLRGSMRVGVSVNDLKIVQECVRMVADFGFITLDKIPDAEEIAPQIAADEGTVQHVEDPEKIEQNDHQQYGYPRKGSGHKQCKQQ